MANARVSGTLNRLTDYSILFICTRPSNLSLSTPIAVSLVAHGVINGLVIDNNMIEEDVNKVDNSKSSDSLYFHSSFLS